MRLDLHLAFDLAEGWLAPHVEGLREGRAVASTCEACGAASFPPRRSCLCGGRAGAWVTLPGAASVLARSEGRDGAFALLRFDGAATSAVARAEGLPSGATRARLLPATGERPALAVGPEETP
jgi:hypothetical protein